MYRNIIFVFIVSVFFFGSSAITLQAKGADNDMPADETDSINAFLHSDFIRSSVWPGIGPFQINSNNHLVDPSGNQLNYSTVGKQISSCQLEMRGGVSESQSMLNLQMSVDFLLEGLGLKPGQIHAVNVDLDKNSKLLIGSNYNPIHTTVAPFVVSLQNLGVTEGTDNSVYRVVVANQNLTYGNLELNKTEENKGAEEKGEGDKTIEIATVPSTKDNSQDLDKVVQPDQSDIGAVEPKADKDKETGQKFANDSQVVPAKPAAKVLTKEEQLKKQFQDVIKNWQSVKKVAIKERNSKLLSQALAGKALIRQTDAIKWLVSNHKFYDMTPGNAKIEKVIPLVGNTKYAVYAEVMEKTKFVDEPTGRVVKETDDTYKVNYTIEKIGQNWFITDSTLIKNSSDNKQDKSGSQKSSVKKTAGENSAKSISKTPH